MKMKSLALLLLSLGIPAAAFAQGSLTPPAAPTPTMKTLDQVEARTPIDAVHTPGDANWEAIISAPGSYYLTGNLGATKPNGIHVTAASVTIDLNGFQITRSSGSGGDGITVDAGAHRCALVHGVITGFANGVNTDAAARSVSIRRVSVANCTNLGLTVGAAGEIADCLAHDNSGTAAIFTGDGSTLTNCAATGNTTGYAIQVGSGCTLRDCTVANNLGNFDKISTQSSCTLHNCAAYNNTGFSGISVGTGCVLTNCTAQGNTSGASVSSGIAAGTGSTLVHCNARGNLSSAASTSLTGMGINVSTDCTIKDCTVSANKGDGIRVSSNCIVIGNESGTNGNGGDGAGIHATGDDNRIEGNNVVENDRGMDVDSAGNIIVRNTASGNGNNWDVVTGNVILVISATTAGAVSGNFGGTAPGSTDPSANFTY
jgi:parallel beta-helix repeat protein